MNEDKLKHLFAAARQEPAPVPAPEFASDVLRAIRREPTAAYTRSAGMFEQLNFLFPRVATAAAAIILLCLAADYGLTAWGWPGLDDAATQASCSLLINPEDS
jgi:hypothetical protein